MPIRSRAWIAFPLLALGGCGGDGGDDGTLMTLASSTARAGDGIELRFTGALAETRGGYFYLEDDHGERVAGLWSATGPFRSPGFTVAMDDFGVLDYAVMGGGPDTLIVPPSMPSGDYLLCTENSQPEVCVELTITAPEARAPGSVAPGPRSAQRSSIAHMVTERPAG